MLYDDDMFLSLRFFVRYLFIFSSRPSPGSRGLDLGGGDCSDRPVKLQYDYPEHSSVAIVRIRTRPDPDD